MAVASLVLGIISILIAWIPFCNYIVAIPAIVGLILGIVALVKANKDGGKKGMSIAGIVTSVIAIAFIVYYTFAAVMFGEKFVTEFEKQMQQELENQIQEGNITINEEGNYEFTEDGMNAFLEEIESENEIENETSVVEEEI